MKTSSLKLLCLTTLLLAFSLSEPLWAQKILQVESPTFEEAAQEPDADGNVVIFSNLGPTSSDRYDSRSFAYLPVAGKQALGELETWVAVNFIPKEDVQARVLLAAINYVSGTKLVNLGLYTDDDGKVGNPIPGAQGSTTSIPDNGECCQLVRVKLPGRGIALTAGTRYWLVASPDNVNAPTFSGSWQVSNSGAAAQITPPGSWSTGFGAWPAAQVRGTLIAAATPPANRLGRSPSSKKVTIFDNLGPTRTDAFLDVDGAEVFGEHAPDGREGWVGLPFVPRANCHAKILAAAIQYLSGDMKVNLGVYSDNNNTVGTLLPDGQASTTSIPPYPGCCDLTTVTLPGNGVALSAHTRYWLVASTDDIDAPTFEGYWLQANVYSNYQQPKFFFWTFVASGWLAAKITGTNP